MKLESKIKKLGFSLTEMAMALLIVSILAAVTIPIVSRQLEKSEEYSYYLAYKTVEKMAANIVVIGDPDESAIAAKPKNGFGDFLIARWNAKTKNVKTFFASIGQKLADAETYVFSKIFPNAIAISCRKEFDIESSAEITSEEFDDIWLAYQVCTRWENDNSVPSNPWFNVPYARGVVPKNVHITAAFLERVNPGFSKGGLKGDDVVYPSMPISIADYNYCCGITRSCKADDEVGYAAKSNIRGYILGDNEGDFAQTHRRGYYSKDLDGGGTKLSYSVNDLFDTNPEKKVKLGYNVEKNQILMEAFFNTDKLCIPDVSKISADHALNGLGWLKNGIAAVPRAKFYLTGKNNVNFSTLFQDVCASNDRTTTINGKTYYERNVIDGIPYDDITYEWVDDDDVPEGETLYNVSKRDNDGDPDHGPNKGGADLPGGSGLYLGRHNLYMYRAYAPEIKGPEYFTMAMGQVTDILKDPGSPYDEFPNIGYSSGTKGEFCTTAPCAYSPANEVVVPLEYQSPIGGDLGYTYDNDNKLAGGSMQRGKLVITATRTITIDAESASSSTSARPSFNADWCTTNGYVGMTNTSAPNGITCECSANYVPSGNLPHKVCFHKNKCPGATPYAQINSDGTYKTEPICCSGDFNEIEQKCCGVNSVYNGSTCACVSGWNQDPSTGKCTVKGPCPKGSSPDTAGKCIANPPLIKAQKFCELVRDNYNISNSSCNTFETKSGDKSSYYKSVYEAALGKDTDKRYLSINSQLGAFKNITPNIEFSNGLAMWILGDKAASIPGMSYFSSSEGSVLATQNMCQKVLKTELADGKYTEENCKAVGGWFCKGTNQCFRLSSDATDLGDARNCCSTVDFTDLQALAEEQGKDYLKDSTYFAVSGFTVFVDINGVDKGEGTLWDDVFPFYISSNGTVYPGYPLDAPKAADSASDALYLGGNSEKQLAVDVYYYEVPASGEGARVRRNAFSGVSYARGLCSASARYRNTPYCKNLGKKFKAKGADGSALADDYLEKDKDTSNNPCDKNKCFLSVRRKLRFF